MAAHVGGSVVKTHDEREDMSDKKSFMKERLQKREDDRMADVQRRKEEKENVSAADEKADFFLNNFHSSRADIERATASSDSLPKSELQDHFDNIIVSIQKLQKFVTDSTMFLSSYEVQKSQNTLAQLSSAVQEKKELLMPKKKFAFKSKKKADNVAAVPDKAVDEPDICVTFTEASFTNMKGEQLVKNPAEINRNDVTLANLEGCTIKLFGYPSTVHMNNLTDCKVFCGPVSSSVFIDGCKNCTFVISCQQLRCHTTTDATFYLHVTSRAIIEDCMKLSFAPYTWTYSEIDQHYQESGLDKSKNNWDDVDDFNWLASDAHSPNWGILQESAREQF